LDDPYSQGEQMHIAQPPLSRQIQLLEEELGVLLIQRSSRPLRLTDAGRVFYEEALQVLHRVEQMKAGAKRVGQDKRQSISIAYVASTLYGGLTPKARVVGMATAGVAPRVMGVGPAPATEKVLAQTGLTLDQIDVIELNEAFAAQGLAVLRMLGLKDDDSRVNAWGGAIALGHPLGASGARLVTTALNRLHNTGGRYALCTMCIGVGQGIALQTSQPLGSAKSELFGLINSNAHTVQHHV
jgi:hypothetical protein